MRMRLSELSAKDASQIHLIGKRVSSFFVPRKSGRKLRICSERPKDFVISKMVAGISRHRFNNPSQSKRRGIGPTPLSPRDDAANFETHGESRGKNGNMTPSSK
ncbi:unnamed protein product [Ilex paraguariensis]|uniref:Uncharacterized protein n=1 Tax=Ilex paraguariensis TaxID=185542 RepID=A0ABC8RKH5_9AQUA